MAGPRTTLTPARRAIVDAFTRAPQAEQSALIALAKAAGKYRGGKPKLQPEQVSQLKARVATGVPKAKVAREFGISRETLYVYLAAPERPCPQ